MSSRRVLFGPGAVPAPRRLAVASAEPYDGDFQQEESGPSAFDSFIGKTPEIRAGNLKLLFSFNGTATRLQYWLLAELPITLLYVLAYAHDLPARMGLIGFLVAFVILAWISLAVRVKRCHDRDKSGWFLLVGLIPLIGPFWILYELGIKGSEPSSSYA